MIIKSIIELPNKSFFNHSFVTHSAGAGLGVHIINEATWFIDIKKAAKAVAGSKTAFVDLEMLPTEYQLPAALAIFKNMYSLQRHKTGKKAETQLYIVKQYETVGLLKSLVLGSDIATEPANKMYPQKVCERVRDIFSNGRRLLGHISVNVKWLDEKEIVKQGLNLVYAVGKGAQRPPRFLTIEIVNDSRRGEDPIALVGKGVVFDSGGYNIKSGPGMTSMKGDKTGAGIAISIMHYFASSANAPNMIAVIPLVENLVSHKAYKVGDIYKAYNGKTVEILNTDAEGRLIMADALAYISKNYKPRLVLDFATLTGWANILHCDTSFVFFTTNDRLGKMIERNGDKTGERSIRLPNWPEYASYTKSDIADYKNVNFECGRSDGFMASMFLMNFVTDPANWVHFDVTHNTNAFNMHYVNSAATAIKLISKL